MLSVNNLSYTRGGRQLFKNISFELAQGECLYLQGENASGKTSLLRIITGIADADCGNVEWKNENIKTSDSFYQELLYLGHSSAIKNELTIIENLVIQTKLDSRNINHKKLDKALKYFNLQVNSNQIVRQLSAGQKRRVLLARLITETKKLWVLDEPFAALDNQAIMLLKSLLQNHLQNLGILIVTSHQNFDLENIKHRELNL